MLHFYEELKSYIQKNVKNKEDAIEIVQETYTKALEFESKSIIKNKRALLYKIAKNIIIDNARKEKNYQNILYEEENHSIPKEEQPEELIFDSIQKDLLKEAVEKLPAKNKQAFVLHFIKGYTKQQIAQIMGISLNAAQKHIRRAIEKIKEYLSLYDWDINE